MTAVLSEPIIIAEWDRNARERIRVSLDKYRSHQIVSIQNFYRSDSGELKPGRGGIRMAVRHLPQLAEAITAALAKARHERWSVMTRQISVYDARTWLGSIVISGDGAEARYQAKTVRGRKIGSYTTLRAAVAAPRNRRERDRDG